MNSTERGDRHPFRRATTRPPGRKAVLQLSVCVCTIATAVAMSASAVSADPAASNSNWLDELVQDCPDLYVLAGQGTGESSPDAPVKADTGMLGTVVSPMLDQARQLGATIDRAYIPYPAGFGGAVAGGKESYAVSVSAALDNFRAAAKKVVESCPATKLAVIGYSQGGHAASNFLEEVGKGQGEIPASVIAAGALFGSPTRSAGSGVFPGTAQDKPSPVPGTTGTAVSALPAVVTTVATGSGIGPVADIAADFGSLTGRVSSWCQTGDLACDAPPDAPIARAVTNVAGQAEVGGDPFVAIQTIGLSLASTAFKVGVDVINEDIQIPKNSIENLSISQRKPLSQRIAEASDPRVTPPTGQEAIAALMKVGLVAMNAVITVAKKVITPATIAEIAAAGLANPVAAFGVIATKTAAAVMTLIPPATTQRLVTQAFNVVKNEVTANKDLFNLAALTKYANVQSAHQSYGSTAATSSGVAPTAYVAQMLAAVAADLHNGSGATDISPATTSVTGSSVPSTTTSRPTSTTTTTRPAPTVTESTFSQNGLSPTNTSEGTTN